MLAAVPAAVAASLAAALAGWPSPLEATAETVMEWTPVDLATTLLIRLGGTARPAALLGALAAAMLVGGIAGTLHRLVGGSGPRRFAGLALADGFFAAVFLVLIPPSLDQPELALIAAFLIFLALVSGLFAPAQQSPAAGRRDVLTRSGIILGGAALLLALFSVRPLLQAVAARRLFPYARPRGLPIAGLTDLVTPASRFYRMDRLLQPPQVGPPGWRLAVDGAVRTPLSLDYATLLALPRHNRYVTMECVDNPVGGPMISTALWTGVSVANLLRAAGAAGDTLVFHGSDVYAESVPRAEVEAVGGMVTYAMNGEALAPEHGYPARFLLPGVYGFKSVKWLERVEVRHGGIEGSWHSQGWTETGQIRTTTRIDVARRRGDVILLAGIAFAGTRGVRAVELRVNGGPWRRATLGRALSSATWVQWTARLSAPGPATVEARAVDRLGQVQTERAHGSYPDGATGWASVAV